MKTNSKRGAFVVDQRLRGVGEWLRIWQSCDGADCAKYLRTCTDNEAAGLMWMAIEYRMRWDPQAERRKNSRRERSTKVATKGEAL